MSTNESGFPVGFSKVVEAILTAGQMHYNNVPLLYLHEVRANLRKAGMIVDRNVEMPDFEDPYSPGYEPDFIDETEQEDTDGD